MWLRKLYLISRNTNESKTNNAVSKNMAERNRNLCKMRTFSVVVGIVRTYRSVEIIFGFFIFFSFRYSVLNLALQLLSGDLFYR